MGRAILAVIVGYIVMGAVVFGGLALAYSILGEDRSYQPATYDVSTMWIVVSIVVGLVSALLGGAVCRAIAKRPKPVIALVVVVAVLGLGMAAVALAMPKEAEARTESVPMFEAINKSREPNWVTIANPIIGIIGVLIGGRALGGGRAADASA